MNITRRLFSVLSDESICRAAAKSITPIDKLLSNKFNIPRNNIELYGDYKCKLKQSYIDSVKHRQDGKLILVSAMTPTKYGEGKTCTSIGLTDGLCKIGENAVATLREPSLGPVFGMKGGATGGGYAQIVPMDDINLHFTGDLHAITSAHNLLSAMIDNHIFWGNKLRFDTNAISWSRVIDMNDRSLRNTIIGLGENSVRENSYDITVASEVMAVFCLSNSLSELNDRLGNIIIGHTLDKKEIKAKDLKANDAMTALLKNAFMPNVVQTLEQNPVLIHGGPFANIAHGCSSIISTKTAMKMADYVVTEAGFGSDLGAEKFFNIKSRQFDLKPDAVVIVATVRALKHHGGFKKSKAKRESSNNQQYIERGFENLVTHIENMKKFNIPVVVAINRFKLDTNMDLKFVKRKCAEIGVEAIVSEHHYRGGKGAAELAKKVVDITKNKTNDDFEYLYSSQMNLYDKINTVASEIYRADNVVFSNLALRKLKQILNTDYNLYPVCIAKTQYSFSDNPKDRGLLTENTINVKDIRLAAGAKFVVVYLGNIMTMPGLPRVPAAENIGVDENNSIYGLF